MSASINYSNLTPTLLLDFANAAQLDPRITFTRASVGSYYDTSGILQFAASGRPRIAFNPVTRESLGLLIEEQRTNFLLRSAELTTSPWANLNCNSTGGHLAPDGTTTATLYTCNGTAPTLFYQTVLNAVTGTGILTSSVYAKAATSTTFTFNTYYPGDTEVNITFTLTGAGTTSDAANSTISSVGNGWYRCTIRTPARVNAGTDVAWRIWPTTRPTATAGLGCYFWGAQLEAGASATSYIPTVASQVTRAAETASIQDITGFFNVVEGSLFFETGTAISTTGQVTYPAVGFTPANLSSSRTIQVFVDNQGSGFTFLVRTAAGDVVGLSSDASERLTPAKIAFAYKANDFAYVVDNNSPLIDTVGDLPTAAEVTALSIGSFNVSGRFNGTIKKIAYYPQRITNTQLQAMTR